MAQLQSSSITGSLIISSSGTDSTTNSLLVTNGAGYEYLKVTDGGTVDVRQNLIVNHATNANRSLRFSWGSIYATDTNNELTLGSVYTDNTATRIYISGKNSDNSPSDAISMQAGNGVAIFSGTNNNLFDPQALLHVSGGGIFTGDLDVTGSLHVLGDLTVGKISNQSELVDVGGNFNFDTVAEPTSAERTNFSSSIISSAGNVDNGTHYYHVIYKTSDGGETGAYGTPFLAATITDNTTAGQVELTGIPTSSDARVTARDIYRSEANGNQYYSKKLATISDNTTTTYTDNLADSSLDQNTLFYRKANSTAGYFYKDNNLFAQAGNVHYTSFGVSALESVTIGQDNVAFGGSALQNTTSGRENTAIGYSSGVSNTTGYGNTYLGYVAGYFNETGIKNTAVGSFALRQATLTSANYNTAVGHGALWKLTGSNNHNTAIGHAAGQGYQGAYNVHIGSYTGYKSTEGSGGDYNINIGYNTGNDTTGDNNILIGRELEAPNSGSSNQLNIGNLIYATGLGLGSTQSTGNVGIGTTTPTRTLDVRGSTLISGSFSGIAPNALILDNTDSSGNPSIMRMIFSGEGGNEALQIGMYSSPTTKPVYFQSTQGSGWGNIVFQKNGGSVGIGTDSPSNKLHVAQDLGSGGTLVHFNNTNATYSQNMYLSFNSSKDVTWSQGSSSGGTVYNTGTRGHSFQVNGTTNVVFNGSGNVGIGTLNPTQALTVEGAISASGNIYTEGSLMLDGVDGLRFNQGGSSVFSPTPGIFYSGTSGQGWYFQVPNNGQEKFSFKLGGTSAGREFRVVDPSWNPLFQVQGTGDAIIANNLTVGGIVTAQEFHTEFVSASIVYQSGSTKFGDTSDDTHSFTGSLQVSGSIRVPDNVKIEVGNSQDLDIYHNGANSVIANATGELIFGSPTYKFKDSTLSSERMVINSSGNVGISTTSPSQKLHVSGNIVAENYYPTVYVNHQGTLLGGIRADATTKLEFKTLTTAPISFQVNSSQKMLITNGGNVGIGSNNPLAGLEIANAENSTLRLTRSSNNGNYLQLQGGSSGAIYNINTSGTQDHIFQTGGNEKMRLTSAGHLGINTTSPESKLTVVGSGGAGDAAITSRYSNSSVLGEVSTIAHRNSQWSTLYVSESGGSATNAVFVEGNKPVIFNAGNVGLGTASPVYPLHINNGTGDQSALFESTDVTNTIGIKDSNSTSINTTGIGVVGDDLFLYAGSTAYNQRLRIQGSTGNVGIGTTSPTNKLDVAGAISTTTGIRVGSAIASEWIKRVASPTVSNGIDLQSQGVSRLFAGSNVGIGTTSPTYKLHIVDPAPSSWGGLSGSLNVDDILIVSSSNVGIGTPSPSARLHVSGGADVLLIEGSGSTANTSIFAIDGNNGRLFEVSDDLSDSLFSVNTIAGLPVMEVFSDNRVTMGAFNQNDLVISGSKVGIGTATPAHKLSVDGNIQLPNGGFIYGQSTGNYLKLDNATYVELGYSSTTAVRADGSAVSIRGTGGTPRLTVQSAGNVGIGTTSPDSPLEIYSDSTTDFLKLTSGGASASPVKLIFEKTTAEQGIIEYNRNGDLEIYNTDGDGGVMLNGRNSEAGDLYVADGGNVGIGITSPSYKLDVSGSINHAGASYIVPATTSGASGATTVLTGTTFDNATLIKASHDNVTTGDYTLELPAASSSTNRTIRIISDSSTDANHNIIIAPTSGDTLDGGASGFTINRNYEGLMVWSDGTEWFIIQSKNV